MNQDFENLSDIDSRIITEVNHQSRTIKDDLDELYLLMEEYKKQIEHSSINIHQITDSVEKVEVNLDLSQENLIESEKLQRKIRKKIYLIYGLAAITGGLGISSLTLGMGIIGSSLLFGTALGIISLRKFT